MIVDDIMRMITMMKTSPQTNLLDLITSTNRNAIGSELEETMQNRVNPDLKPTVDQIGFRGELEKLKNVIQPTEMLDILEGAYDGFLDGLFDFEFPQRQQNQLLDETNIEIIMDAFRNLRIKYPGYYKQVVDIAAFFVSELSDVLVTNNFLEMMYNIVFHLELGEKYELPTRIAKNILKKLDPSEKTGKDN